jgi:hypothetical protein
MSKKDKPKRFARLGWIEVEQLRPADTSPEYSGKWLLNLDMATKIQFPEKPNGTAIVHFVDGSQEALEDANNSRLLLAIRKAAR